MSLVDKNEVFDYYQEVARSGFADMLHDEERNEKYSKALKEAIETMHLAGRKAKVLDIGTGTGLLSMLAAKHKADSVVSVEAFSPVSHIARKIIQQNGFKDKIKIINKHSTEVTVGEGKDMEEKANILVAEVFDTELIGEGAIKTYNHAHQFLMEKDCLCVPNSAKIWIQIVDCRVSWNTFEPIHFDDDCVVKCPESIEKCRGVSSIHDIQLSQLPMEKFTTLGEPFELCNFDFSGKSSIPTRNSFTKEFTVVAQGKANTIFFWWDLSMNSSGTNLLSCAPHWSHPDTETLAMSKDEVIRRNSIPWRDHWLQGCFYVKSKLALETGSKACVKGHHDEFSWFFEVRSSMQEDFEPDFPSCSCCFHSANSRNRILQMNNHLKYLPYLQTLQNEKEKKCILFLGDHNPLTLMAASVLKESKNFMMQEDRFCRLSFANFKSEAKKIDDIYELKSIKVEQLTNVIGEPHYNSSALPWDNIIKFAKQVNMLREIQKTQLSIMPCRASIYAVPVHFLNLHKIRWPLKSTCGGFNHELFDTVIELASSIADENVEPFSLWEYPCIALGPAKDIFGQNFYDENIHESTMTLSVENFTKTCNGIAFWVEWKINESSGFSDGPLEEIKTGELITWKMEERQGVHLVPFSKIELGNIDRIEIKTVFNEKLEKLAMDFIYRYQSL